MATIKEPERRVIKIRFSPFGKQIDCILSAAQIRAAVTGARGGKTFLGTGVAVNAAILQPNYSEFERERDDPYKIGIGAPSYPMINHVIRDKVIKMVPKELQISAYHHTHHLLRVRGVHGETHIRFISARNPESWFGEKLHFAWIDEFALVKEGMFDEIMTRLTPIEGQAPGRLLLTGTPQGPNWAFKRLYQPWVTGDNKDIDFFTWATADNPHISREYLARMKATLPPRYYRRTFEATWETFEGQIYEEFLPEVHRLPTSAYSFKLRDRRTIGLGAEEVALKEVIAGVDWGFGVGHPGVIVVCGQDYLGRWWVLEESVQEALYLEGKRPTEDSWVKRARALRAKWGISDFYCDPSEPANIGIFNRAMIPAGRANNDIQPGIQCVAALLHIDDNGRTRLFFLDNCVNTLEEVGIYHWEEGKERPAKVHDHTMDALRYALYSHTKHGDIDRELGYDANV